MDEIKLRILKKAGIDSSLIELISDNDNEFDKIELKDGLVQKIIEGLIEKGKIKMKKCPKCGSLRIIIERSPHGHTECLSCGLKLRHQEWGAYPSTTNEMIDEHIDCIYTLIRCPKLSSDKFKKAMKDYLALLEDLS